MPDLASTATAAITLGSRRGDVPAAAAALECLRSPAVAAHPVLDRLPVAGQLPYVGGVLAGQRSAREVADSRLRVLPAVGADDRDHERPVLALGQRGELAAA